MLEAKELRLPQPQREKRYTRLPGEKAQPAPKAKARVMLVCLVAACALMGLAVLVQYSRMVAVSRDIQRTEHSIEQNLEENRVLKQEVAQLGSLERIEKIAREEKGMHKPNSEQIFLLSEPGEDTRLFGED